MDKEIAKKTQSLFGESAIGHRATYAHSAAASNMNGRNTGSVSAAKPYAGANQKSANVAFLSQRTQQQSSYRSNTIMMSAASSHGDMEQPLMPAANQPSMGAESHPQMSSLQNRMANLSSGVENFQSSKVYDQSSNYGQAASGGRSSFDTGRSLFQRPSVGGITAPTVNSQRFSTHGSRAGPLYASANVNESSIEDEDNQAPEDKQVGGDAVAKATQDSSGIKFGPYSWFVLAIILGIRVLYQWQRAIFSYSYGYKGLGEQAKNAVFEMSTAYPELSKNFGILTGVAYTLPFALTGLFFGKATPFVNRKMVLAAAMAGSGVTMGLVSTLDSFGFLAMSRVLLGMIAAAFNPMSFSLLSEYFPDDKRATANSILQCGNFVGWGMSSLSIILIKALGWRKTFSILGVLSFMLSAASLFFIKEPKRIIQEKIKEAKESNGGSGSGNQEQVEEKKPNYKDLFKNPVNRLVLVGTFFRNLAGSVNTYYLPVFFLQIFPGFKTAFSTMNALNLSVLGMISGVGAGIISDKLESKNKNFMSKAWTIILGCGLALPLMAITTLQTSNFWLSLICSMIFTLFNANFSGMAITMMQNSSEKIIQPLVISTYFFMVSLGQTAGPYLMSLLTKRFDVVANPTLYGPIITCVTALGFLGTCPIWYKCGREYEKIMKRKEAEKMEAAGSAA